MSNKCEIINQEVLDKKDVKERQVYDVSNTEESQKSSESSTEEGQKISESSTEEGQKIGESSTEEGHKSSESSTEEGHKSSESSTEEGHKSSESSTEEGHKSSESSTEEGHKSSESSSNEGQKRSESDTDESSVFGHEICQIKEDYIIELPLDKNGSALIPPGDMFDRETGEILTPSSVYIFFRISRRVLAVKCFMFSFIEYEYDVEKKRTTFHQTPHDNYVEISHLVCEEFTDKTESVVVHYNPTRSKPQIGPKCGFAALAMASQLLNEADTEKLFLLALSDGLTRIGELFNAYELGDFAARHLSCEATVITNLAKRKLEILNHICAGGPVLIPFDHYNKAPGIFFGKYAHWALICGFFFSARRTVDSERGLRFISTANDGKYMMEKLLNDYNDNLDDVFVLVREGSNDGLFAWRLSLLLTSNYNLLKCPKSFGLRRDYLLPNLRDKAVLLKKK